MFIKIIDKYNNNVTISTNNINYIKSLNPKEKEKSSTANSMIRFNNYDEVYCQETQEQLYNIIEGKK